jgi:ABC-2 type transport system permease protein
VTAPVSPKVIPPIYWPGCWALYRMELRRFFKIWQVTIAGPALTAALYLLVIGAALGDARGSEAGAFLVTYAATGLIMFALIDRGSGNLAFSFTMAKIETSIQDILMSPLGPADMMIGYCLATATGGLITAAAVAVVVIPLLGVPVTAPLVLILFALLAAAMASLTGMLIGIWADKWDHLAAALTFFLLPLLFLSGVFAPIEEFPPMGQALIRLSPFYHAVDGFRFGFLGSSHDPIWVHILVLLGFCAALAGINWRLLRGGYKLRS